MEWVTCCSQGGSLVVVVVAAAVLLVVLLLAVVSSWIPDFDAFSPTRAFTPTPALVVCIFSHNPNCSNQLLWCFLESR